MDTASRISTKAFDKPLHSLGALPLHAGGGMGIGAEGKCRRGVAQIILHGLYIIPGPETVHGISMPLRYNNDKPEEPSIFNGFRGFKPDF